MGENNYFFLTNDKITIQRLKLNTSHCHNNSQVGLIVYITQFFMIFRHAYKIARNVRILRIAAVLVMD